MESQIVITEVKAVLSFKVEELAKLKEYLEGTTSMSGYFEKIVGSEVMEFANGLNELIDNTIKSIGSANETN